MGKNRRNQNTPEERIRRAGQAHGQSDRDFENYLNRLLKGYKNQGKLLERINRIKTNSNYLTKNLSAEQKRILAATIRQYEVEEKIKKNLVSKVNIYRGILTGVKSIFKYLELNDDVIKTSSLNLGLSRNLSNQYRDNLVASSKYAARLGMSISQMTKAQESYNAETGQSLLLSEKSLKSVTLIAQGTSLGAEGAGLLAGQFKLLGLNAKKTEKFVTRTAQRAGLVGVNLNAVLKDISTNFKTIQSYNFSNGINGVQKMAMYASMYKIDIQSAFASIDKARTLEGAVEMSAKLMVMGGEFAKQNMFELGFLARNKPEEYIKKLNQMTKGTYFFNKEIGEFQASAFDLDRLRAVADATGIPFQNLTEQARRLAEVNLAKTQLIGLSKDEQDFVANMAEFNNGRFEIQLGGDMIDIKNLGTQQLKLLREQSTTLDKRAKDAMTFDKEFTATVEELKTVLLPSLKYLNQFLRSIQEYSMGLRLLIIGGIGVGIVAGAKLLSSLVTTGITVAFNGFLSRFGALLSSSGGGGGFGGGGSGGGKKGGALGKMGGVAGSALAVGGAFLAASYGVKMIAEAFKELDPEQLNAVTTTIIAMGVAIPLSILAIAGAATVGWPGLLALSGALLAVGLSAMGIGKGIEFASNGLSNLFSKITADNVKNISKMGLGIAGIGLSLMSLANPITVAGIVGFGTFLGLLALNKNNLSNLSKFATDISSGSSGFKQFGNLIDKISLMNNDSTIKELRSLVSDLNKMKKINPLTELKDLLSKPLKVEFADKNVGMVVNISSMLDSKVLAKNVYPHLAKLIRSDNENK